MTVTREALHAEGPKLSRLIAGAWRFNRGAETSEPAALARFIAEAVELGITSFDHAAVYGGYTAEALFGAALKLWGGRRETIEIVTKSGISGINPAFPETRVKHYDTSAAHIEASLNRSLRNLGTDYADLLLIHRPDPFMDAEDCARGLERAVKSGKARAIGVSNFLPHQVRLLQSRLSLPLVTNQIEFSLLNTDPLTDGALDQAQEARCAPMIWSPLGGGGLFGDPTEAARIRAALSQAGERHGCGDISAIALAWIMAHPSRPFPVLGTTRIERLRSAAAAAEIKLSRQDWFGILEAARGAAVA